jgi:ketosteroid isomerase-like protein
MKPTAAILFVFMLCSLGLYRALGQDEGHIAQAVLQLEQQWAEAQRDGKPDVVAPMLADDFITIGTDGKLTGKKELLAHLDRGDWEQNEISDVKVIVHGDTAVATGLWTGKGMMGTRRIDLHERWTDTWVRTSTGQWQCLASQQTEIKR